MFICFAEMSRSTNMCLSRTYSQHKRLLYLENILLRNIEVNLFQIWTNLEVKNIKYLINQRTQLCSITYYSSPSCCGHSFYYHHSVFYKKNTINIQIFYKNLLWNPLVLRFIFYSAHYSDKIPSFHHKERYGK